MSDPNSGFPGGRDPADPSFPDESSLGANRAEAIEAEKKKWRDKQRQNKQRKTRTTNPKKDDRRSPD